MTARPAQVRGIKIFNEPGIICARLMIWSPVACAMVWMALTTFLSLGVVIIRSGAMNPSMLAMMVDWVVILLAGATAFAWHWREIKAGKYDLILGERTGCMKLPRTMGRKTRRCVPFAGLTGVKLQTINEPKDSEATPKYGLTLCFGHYQPETERLMEWFDEAGARDFVHWLQSVLPPRVGPKRPLAGRF